MVHQVTYGGGNTTHNGGHTAGRGTETCSIVETMFSMRTAYEITGNITFMDRLERLAFNSLPAALWPVQSTTTTLRAPRCSACPRTPV